MSISRASGNIRNRQTGRQARVSQISKLSTSGFSVARESGLIVHMACTMAAESSNKKALIASLCHHEPRHTTAVVVKDTFPAWRSHLRTFGWILALSFYFWTLNCEHHFLCERERLAFVLWPQWRDDWQTESAGAVFMATICSFRVNKHGEKVTRYSKPLSGLLFLRTSHCRCRHFNVYCQADKIIWQDLRFVTSSHLTNRTDGWLSSECTKVRRDSAIWVIVAKILRNFLFGQGLLAFIFGSLAFRVAAAGISHK